MKEQSISEVTMEPVILSVVGKKKVGKTTLIERLIPIFRLRGYRVGTVKHTAHRHEFDTAGKDSWRHRQAGSEATVLMSPFEMAFFRPAADDREREKVLSFLFEGYDVVLVEGFKSLAGPKVEVFDPSMHPAPICSNGDGLIALVSSRTSEFGVPVFAPGRTEDLADFIEERLLA